MATKFFTNKDNKTLIGKLEGIFTNTHVHYFDVLVGFFRASGYFRIRPLLKNVSKIRILVGIDVDHLISEAARKGLEFNFNTDITREEFIAELKSDIQSAEYKKNVEEGILEFINDIIDERIEIKAHPSKKQFLVYAVSTPSENGKKFTIVLPKGNKEEFLRIKIW